MTSDSLLANEGCLKCGKGYDASSITVHWKMACLHNITVCEDEGVLIYFSFTLVAPWENRADFIVLRIMRAAVHLVG